MEIKKTIDFTNPLVDYKPIKYVKFYKIHKDAVIPKRYSEGAAGYDLTSINNAIIQPHEGVIINTGLFIDLHPSLFGMIVSRSGLSIRNGIEVKNSYIEDRKEIKITLFNNTNIPFTIEKSMRIAQMILIRKNIQ
ncbi:deoxyuridine 5'-triphosphate nucleotidohydrolase [Enterocytozoon bieneusi H348]|nr:deoxyuridine 5'-triphosphate nucleotidohydrolase [Enterocytozoon bieneusi H348]|eukprot:XP_002650429.1 deoxyuridine 5'-triphosphate nucleotidohydrolase [Enterocytozoon bieneusi H348]